MEKKQRINIESLQQVVGERFGRYSKYIIQDRALPDVRDGLKPVQRRILYAMFAEGNTNAKPFRKSAKTVGNVIGNYHPHGDGSVYEAMVRLSQEWKMLQPLVQMHGNNGSIDGDSAAAMRYTEARLSEIAGLLLENIDKKTVDFIPNFDDTHTEPTVLPARYPNLLVNGSTGISAGYATDIPPHNLNEVIDATMYLIEHPQADIDTLMKHMSGPDFPGGGIVQGVAGIRQAFETGKGKVILRSKVETIEHKGKHTFVISEIPYEVNKANLVRQMDEIRVNKSIEGIAEVRDESDREGLRIVVELKKDAHAKAIENYLYKNTDLQVNYNYNMIAIYNGRPVLMGIKRILTAYVEHQLDVLTRRTNFDLQKALKRAHIVEGLIKALSILDQVIQTIRESTNRQNAIDNLISSYDFTSEQAESIVQLQLYRLTNTDVVALETEAAELSKNIACWKELLSSEEKMRQQLIAELAEVRTKISAPRRTTVEAQVSDIVIEADALIAKRAGIVTVTRDGYVKFTSHRSYSASNGEGHGHKASDVLLAQYEAENSQTLIAITTGGSYLFVPVHTIPEQKWKETGVHFSTIVQYDSMEKIIAVVGVSKFVPGETCVLLASKLGYIKKVDIADLPLQRYTKAAKIMGLKGDDEVVAVAQIASQASEDILLLTRDGLANVFSLQEVPVAGLKAQGVKSMKLSDEDHVAAMVIGDQKASAVLYFDRGTRKRISFAQLEYTGRYRKGFRVIKKLKAQPYELIGATAADAIVNLVTSEGTLTLAPEKLALADLQTVGKKITDVTEITLVTTTVIAKIAEAMKKPSAGMQATDVVEKMEELIEAQGVIFDA